MAENRVFLRARTDHTSAWHRLLAVSALVVFALGVGVIRQARAVDNETTYTGTTVWDTGSVDDAVSSAITLPFTFNFYGTNYTQVVLTSNGVLTFGASASAAYANTDFPTSMYNSVLAFWDDLYLTSVGGTSQSALVYKVAGTAPYRQLIAQWTTMYYCCGSAIQMGTFQIILYETSNVVQIQYRNIVGTGRSQGNSATIGIQGSSSQYVKFLANVASPSLVDGFALRYTPNGATYTQTAGATYDPVYVIGTSGVESPVLASPTDGATGVSTTPTLSWSQAANATGYKVYLATDSQFAVPVGASPYTIASGSTTTWMPPSALANNTTYYWKVESLRNALTALSSTRSFTTSAVAKTSQATLTVVPASSTVGVGSTINLSSSGGSGTGAVTYAVASGSGYCSITGSVLTGTNTGTCTITATKAADATYYSATSVAVTITVNAVVSYTVTYNGNSNTGGSAPAAGTGNSGSTFTVAANSGSLVRTGYTFGGWNTAANGSGTNYTAGSGTFTLAGDTTLYATWTANNLTVTYDSQGGSAIASGSTVTGGSIASSPGTPTRSGYTFKGWFAAASGGSALTFPYAHGQTGNFTLYAQWLTNQTGLAISAAPTSLAYQSTVTVGTTGGNGTGTVSYASNTPGVCSVNASSGLVNMLVSSGTCTIATTKGSDGTYASATATVDIAAAKAAQSTLNVTSTSATYGQAYSLTASGGSGTGAVTWQVVSGSCTVSGSTLTPGDAGSSCVVRATKATDSNYLAQDSADTSVSINKAAQSTLTVTSTSATYGTDLSLTATGGSGLGGLTWTVVSGTCTVSGATLTPGNAGSSCVVKVTRVTDTNFLEASSANTTITIARATQATLTVSSTSATYGQSYSLTTSGGSGSGAVSWQVVSGTCTVSASTLTPGNAGSSCIVRATKAQETNYNVATSADTAVTIARATQAAVTVTSTSATFGQSYSLTTSGGSGSGAVTWQVVLGTCTVSGSTLTPGDAGSTCQVKATKAQDTNYLVEESVNTTVAVNRASQATLTLTSTNATYGETLPLTASGGSGGGDVSFAVVSGTCSVSGTILTPGDAGSSCVVRATKALDSNYNAANSADTTVSIARTSQTNLTVVSTSAVYGQGYALTTSGGSGSGAVTWQVVSGTCTVSGSTLTPGDAGSSCVVRATKAQSTNYNAVDSADTAVAIARTTQSILTVTSTSATYGQNYSLTTSGGSGTGAVTWQVVLGTCTVSGSTLSPGDAGSMCQVKATKAQSTNYHAADSADTTVVINKANQSTLSVTSTSATYGQNYTLTTSGGSGTGAVSWSVTSGTCTVSGSTLTPGNAGSLCNVRASKATDTNYNQVYSSSTTVTINKAPQSGLSVTSPSFFVTGTPLTLTAAGGQSTGSLSWAVTAGSCSLSGSTLTATRGGIACTVEVTRAGDSNYLASTDSLVITVNKIAQVLTFRSAAPSPANPGTTYTVSVESDAFLAPTIAIANGSSTVCSVAAGVVTFNAVGSCVISASQAGNDVYSSAAASQAVNVVAVAAAAPATTAPAVSVPVAPASSVAPVVEATTTTVPSVKSPVVTTTTVAPVVTTTTTTTTTTTIPADPGQPVVGVDGEVTELAAGETFAIVRGQKVDAKIDQVNDALVITLPNEVKITIGPLTASSDSAKVSTDGILRVFNNQSVDVSSEGLVPGTTYTVFMFSDPVELGRGSASADGRVSTSVLIPKDAKAEQHTLQLNGVGKGGEVVSVSVGFKIVERQNNTRIAVLAISLGMLLALLGGRPVFRRRRGIR